MVNLIQMIVAQAATTAFEVIMQKKTLDLIESSEKEWNENFRYFVSGYYEGIAIRYLWPVLCIFLVLCTIGSYISGSENWGYSLFFMACAIAMFVYTIVLQKNMWVILYWEGGLLFMDRGGNMVSKIPSNALSQVKFKGRKIIIPYNGKRYVIVRCKNDNEKDVQEMLQFYHLVWCGFDDSVGRKSSEKIILYIIMWLHCIRCFRMRG